MKHMRMIVVAVLTVSLPLTGCQTMTPGQQATIAGIGAGILAGGIAAATGSSVERAVGIGLTAGVVTGAAVYYVAKRKASAHQQMVAAQCAASYESRVRAGATPAPKSRYVAVETDLDSRSVGKSSVMLWDTQSDRLLPDVYDLRSSPRPGSVATYDEIEAVYVAKGK